DVALRAQLPTKVQGDSMSETDWWKQPDKVHAMEKMAMTGDRRAVLEVISAGRSARAELAEQAQEVEREAESIVQYLSDNRDRFVMLGPGLGLASAIRDIREGKHRNTEREF